ncbi:MAG: kinase/pyrophosphorylase [Bacteroidales bacterium]|nr:kinase/pyrophosphorylase [Bacteroidales bacterium]
MNQKTNQQNTPIFIVSGGKGMTGYVLVNSLLIQYPDNRLPVITVSDVLSHEKIEEVVLRVKKANGILTHTMINSQLRKQLIETCRIHGVKEIDFMGPLADYLEKELGMVSSNFPGLYRRINSEYFKRIEAIEFATHHDDGLNTDRLLDAEIILTGVSRTGKTPLSVYLSVFGWKVANVPIIPGIEPPKQLFEVDPNRVFGLTININYLIAQRSKRLARMGDIQNKDYIDYSHVRNEIQYANLIFDRGKFTRISVTNKPIETSANEIIGFISDRFAHEDRRFELPEPY